MTFLKVLLLKRDLSLIKNKMAEHLQSEQFDKSYKSLLEDLSSSGLNTETFDNYISTLKYSILQEIEDSGRIPMYAIKIYLEELIAYSNYNRDGHTIDLVCTFEPIEEKKPDLIVNNSYSFPQSAHSTFDTSNGENIVTVSWEEYPIK